MRGMLPPPARRGLALVLLLAMAGCADPGGIERRICDAGWLEVAPIVAQQSGVREGPLPIECFDEIANRRVRVGFTLPAGPDCHLLHRVEIVESADAVSITLVGAVDDDRNVGACPEGERMVVTEVDLAAPIDQRTLLDGSEGG